MSPAIGALYLRNSNFFTSEESAEYTNELFENIRSSFIDMLNNGTWMDENTKNAAVDKARSTVAHIGFSKELSNITKLEHHYKSLTLNESEFFLNALRLNKFQMDYDFHRLHEPVHNDKWQIYTALGTGITALYVMQQNEIRKLIE